MKNQTNLTKRIRNIIVGNTLPANEDLWLDTSDGEKKSVLKYKGNPIVGGGNNGQSDSGYTVTKSYVIVDEETVTITSALDGSIGANLQLNLDALVSGETYKVTFNGVEYECTASTEDGDIITLGAPYDESTGIFDFSTYPFNINNDFDPWGIFTAEEGTYTIKIEHLEESIETTPEFKQAVDSVTGYSLSEEGETLYEGTVETVEDEGFFYGTNTSIITFVEGDTYKVIFNGIEYTCKCFDDEGSLAIGATYGDEGFDWSTYPFYINPTGNQLELLTNQEGSCTLKIEHITTSTKTTPEFESMIQGIAGGETVYYEDLTDDEWDILRSANPGTTFNGAKKVTTANADTNRVVVWDERYEGNGGITNLYVAEVLYMGNKPYVIRLQNVYNSTTFELQIPFNHYVNSISTEGLSDDYFYYFETETNG